MQKKFIKNIKRYEKYNELIIIGIESIFHVR